MATDTAVIDRIAEVLAAPDWDGATDFLDEIADLIGNVRPHPGNVGPLAYAAAFREATGRELPRVSGYWDDLDEDDDEGPWVPQ